MPYDLIETFGSTQASWASTNDQNIDVAMHSSTPETFFWLAISRIISYISWPLALLIFLLCAIVAIYLYAKPNRVQIVVKSGREGKVEVDDC